MSLDFLNHDLQNSVGIVICQLTLKKILFFTTACQIYNNLWFGLLAWGFPNIEILWQL